MHRGAHRQLLTVELKNLGLDVDGDVDAGREIEFLELVDRLGRRLNDIDQTFVRARLELLHRLLVDVGRTIHGKLLDPGRKWNGTGDPGAGALGGLDNLRGGLIDDTIVEALEFDANALAFHNEKRTIVRNELGPSKRTR